MRQPKKTSTGKFRVYGVTNTLTNKPCVWIATSTDEILTKESILTITNHSGHTQEVFLQNAQYV